MAPAELRLEKNVAVGTRGGSKVFVNVRRPAGDGKFPALVMMSPYNKDFHWTEQYPTFPDIPLNEDMTWEIPDPHWWVPRGYAIVQADSPGFGQSPGIADPLSKTEVDAYYDVIEWAARQPWCNGKVGALGISYFAMIQWLVAAEQPPSLAAIVPWEGLSDLYREWAYQGGIFANAHNDSWCNRQFPRGQFRSNELDDGELAKARVDWRDEMAARPLNEEWYHQRTPELERIAVPLLSVGNWNSLHLHLRGSTEGFLRASSKDKWLIIHSGNHVSPFYSEYGRQVQAQFLDYWLKGEDTGLMDVPRVRLAVRHGRRGVRWRGADAWPLPETQWTKMYLHADGRKLDRRAPDGPGQASYEAPGGSLVFDTAPVSENLEITGPVVLNVRAYAHSEDMDLFVTLRHVDANGEEIWTEGPHNFGQRVPMAMGWLRASHRSLDPDRSTFFRPFHPHEHLEPLPPGKAVDLAVEIWPTSMVLSPGERLRLVIAANDDESIQGHRREGMRHNDLRDRADERFSGENVILTGGDDPSHLLLPVIPST